MKPLFSLILTATLAMPALAAQRQTADLLVLCKRADFSATNKALCGYAQALKNHLDQLAQDPLNDVPAYQDIQIPREVACLYPSVRPTTFCNGLELPPFPYREAIPWPQGIAPVLSRVKGKLIKPFIVGNLSIPDNDDFPVEVVCKLINNFSNNDRILCAATGQIALIDRAIAQPWKLTHKVNFDLNQTSVTSYEHEHLYDALFVDLEDHRRDLARQGFDVQNGKFEVTKAVIRGYADPSGPAAKNEQLSRHRADNVEDAVIRATSRLGIHCPRHIFTRSMGENYEEGSCLDGGTESICTAPGYPRNGQWDRYQGGRVCPRGYWKYKETYDHGCLARARAAVVELTIKFNEKTEFVVPVRLN